MKFKILFLSIVFGSIFLIISCKVSEETKETKKAEKLKLEQQKEYEKLVKAHLDRQTAETKERMEETKKQSEFYNKHKKRNFFQRIFGNNQTHKKPRKKKK